jgi:quercetin dioxygenase-like cupin family protein
LKSTDLLWYTNLVDAFLDERLDPAELTAIAVAFARSTDGWRHQVRFDDNDVLATMLYADHRVDVWLSTWLPGQATPLQHHNGSASSLIVIQGQLDELRYGRSGWRSHRRHRVGRSVWIAPGTVHSLGNRTRAGAVSISAFSPPLWRTSSVAYDEPAYSTRVDELVPTG